MTGQVHSPASDSTEAGPKAFEAVCTVKSNDLANDAYRLLVLDAPRHILKCQPGQFFHLLCPVTDQHQPYLRRPMSIYSFDEEAGELTFLYKVEGEGTKAMATLTPGDSFNVLGPLGVGYSIKPDWNNLLLVARGVGLATLAPLAQEAARLGRKLTAICSARSEAALLSTEHFRRLGTEVISVTDEDGSSSVDNLRRLIETRIAEEGVDAFYTCGSNRLLKLLQELGQKHDIPGEIALEQQMACGLGMCQCCVRPFRKGDDIVQLRVCKEGPVFDLQEAMGW